MELVNVGVFMAAVLVVKQNKCHTSLVVVSDGPSNSLRAVKLSKPGSLSACHRLGP